MLVMRVSRDIRSSSRFKCTCKCFFMDSCISSYAFTGVLTKNLLFIKSLSPSYSQSIYLINLWNSILSFLSIFSSFLNSSRNFSSVLSLYPSYTVSLLFHLIGLPIFTFLTVSPIFISLFDMVDEHLFESKDVPPPLFFDRFLTSDWNPSEPFEFLNSIVCSLQPLPKLDPSLSSFHLEVFPIILLFYLSPTFVLWVDSARCLVHTPLLTGLVYFCQCSLCCY